MDTQTIETIGRRMMDMALDNLMRDGYASFACIVVSHDGQLAPLLLETVNDESKMKLGAMLRRLAPHCAAIVIISEAWTVDCTEPVHTYITRVSDNPVRKEGVFVHVGSTHGDYVLMAKFERYGNGWPMRPTEVDASWKDAAPMGVPTNFQGLFA